MRAARSEEDRWQLLKSLAKVFFKRMTKLQSDIERFSAALTVENVTPASILFHDAFLLALPFLLAFVIALFIFPLAAGKCEINLDAAVFEVQVERH